jgi:hypothetical protein
MLRLVYALVVWFEFGVGSLLAQSKIQGINWFPIGPADINGGQTYGGGRVNVSGRATSIAVNPFNPKDVWLGTANGGVWHSTNSGTNWKPMSDDQDSLAVGALALDDCDATSCGSIFAGTGENSLRRDTYYGNGLLIGGMSGGEFSTFLWTPSGVSQFKQASINNIVLDPTTSGGNKVIYVALSSGVTASASESTVTGPTPGSGYGIYKSMNRGGTWNPLSVPGSAGVKPTDLKMSPSDNMVLYAGFLGKGIFKTTNGGSTWCPLNPGIPLPAGCVAATGLPDPTTTTFDYVEIAIFPGNSSILYASLGSCPNPIGDSCGPAIYKSSDAGSSWTLQLAADPSLGFAFNCPRQYSRYTHVLMTHPTDSHTLYLGGTELCVSSTDGTFFTDFGSNTVHPDHHSLVFPDPEALNQMYDASDGGFAYSNDGGTSWTSGNADLQITGFQSIAISPLTARIIGGTQDNGTEMWTGTRVWRHISDGDTGFTIIDLNGANTMYDTDTRSVGGGLDGTPARSDSGGMDFFPTEITTGIDTTEPASFYPVFIQDSSPPHPLYFATNRLYKSTNQGNSWSPVSPNLGGTAFFPDINRANVITAVAIAPDNPNRIYVGYYDGQIWTTNSPCASTGCWAGPASGLPHAPVTWIAVDPNKDQVAYASFSGFNIGPHVFKTTNALSWNSSSGGLPDLPVDTISIEPSTPANIWLGTDQGVYKSTTSGDSWNKFGTGLPNTAVYSLAIDESRGRVFAGTHGRGSFVLTQPFLTNYEGWVNNQIWDIPVYGNGFLSNQSCTMQIIQQNGNVCASGTTDGRGGTIMTDINGTLVTSNGGFYMNQPVAFACFNGVCLGGTPIASCNTPTNPISTVTATCGGLVGIDLVLGCPRQANPPSSVLGLNGSPSGTGPITSSSRRRPQAVFGSAGAFDFIPTVQSGDGTTRALCVVHVPVQSSDNSQQILQNAGNAVNSSAACATNSVSAIISGLVSPGQSPGEDSPTSNPRLSITAPSVNGGQLLTALHAGPGQGGGACFNVSNLGVPITDSVTIMRLSLETLASGATGGQITMTERTDVGSCTISVPTTPGNTANQIASALADAFQAPGIPGPNPNCLAPNNPRDVTADGPSVLTVMANGVEICVKDGGVGFALLPDELPLSSINLVPPTRVLTFVASPEIIHEGDSATLTWTTENATDVTITNVGTVLANGSVKVSPIVDTIYTINAVGDHNDADAFVTVKVIPKAQPPVADAGPDKSVYANYTTLDGSKSYDPQGSPLTFSWRFVAFQPKFSNFGPFMPTITGGNTATPSVTIPQAGDYIFELTVTDALGLQSTATVRITRQGVDP